MNLIPEKIPKTGNYFSPKGNWEAERLMNEMAEQGWEVVSVTYWNAWKLCLLITFAR